jgi:hypothetical protein
MNSTLGRLQRVDLRTVWKHEAQHFTPWLARPENIALLGEAIDLNVEVQAQEQAVGPFRADLVCRDVDDGNPVLIENQLERTDHSHLGQLLTYAAGSPAITLVWIAERFTDEHRAALEWLNTITADGIHFFALEIELWRIGDSPPAPKFNIVVQPNEWTRTVQRATQAGATPVAQMQLAYWTAFSEFLASRKTPFKPPTPYTINWMSWGVGKGGIQLIANVNAEHIGVGLDIDSRAHPTWFHKLHSERAAIEAEIGFEMDWDEKPQNKFSRVRIRRTIDMHDTSNWPAAHEWLLAHMTPLAAAIRPRAARLDDTPIEVHVP